MKQRTTTYTIAVLDQGAHAAVEDVTAVNQWAALKTFCRTIGSFGMINYMKALPDKTFEVGGTSGFTMHLACIKQLAN